MRLNASPALQIVQTPRTLRRADSVGQRVSVDANVHHRLFVSQVGCHPVSFDFDLRLVGSDLGYPKGFDFGRPDASDFGVRPDFFGFMANRSRSRLKAQIYMRFHRLMH